MLLPCRRLVDDGHRVDDRGETGDVEAVREPAGNPAREDQQGGGTIAQSQIRASVVEGVVVRRHHRKYVVRHGVGGVAAAAPLDEAWLLCARADAINDEKKSGIAMNEAIASGARLRPPSLNDRAIV